MTNMNCLALRKLISKIVYEAEFKEFEPWLKYVWFRIKVYSMFQDSSRHSI